MKQATLALDDAGAVGKTFECFALAGYPQPNSIREQLSRLPLDAALGSDDERVDIGLDATYALLQQPPPGVFSLLLEMFFWKKNMRCFLCSTRRDVFFGWCRKAGLVSGLVMPLLFRSTHTRDASFFFVPPGSCQARRCSQISSPWARPTSSSTTTRPAVSACVERRSRRSPRRADLERPERRAAKHTHNFGSTRPFISPPQPQDGPRPRRLDTRPGHRNILSAN